MSTTRWIMLCTEHEGGVKTVGIAPNGSCHRRFGFVTPCQFVERIVVDPDNLPPERVERAGIVIAGSGIVEVLELDRIRSVTADAVRAFLSDPEPGDQT